MGGVHVPAGRGFGTRRLCMYPGDGAHHLRERSRGLAHICNSPAGNPTAEERRAVAPFPIVTEATSTYELLGVEWCSPRTGPRAQQVAQAGVLPRLSPQPGAFEECTAQQPYKAALLAAVFAGLLQSGDGYLERPRSHTRHALFCGATCCC